MSGELLTRKERRIRQAVLIESEGREMPSPCSACRNARVPEGKSRPRCIVDVRFGCCSECVRKGYSSCDVSVTWTEWERLREQRRRLKRKLEEAEEKVTEAMAHVHRLRKQLRVAEEREEKAITKEFTALQELPSEVSENPSDFLLEPEGEPSEIAEVFQLPLESWTEISLLPDDPFWPVPSSVDRRSDGTFSKVVSSS
jgi:hypothetical protein